MFYRIEMKGKFFKRYAVQENSTPYDCSKYWLTLATFMNKRKAMDWLIELVKGRNIFKEDSTIMNEKEFIQNILNDHGYIKKEDKK